MKQYAIAAAVLFLFIGVCMADDFKTIINEVFMNSLNASDCQRTVEIYCKSTPTDPMFGYGDTVRVFIGTELVGQYEGSSCPNGFKVLEEKELPQYNPHVIIRNAKIENAIYQYVVMWDSIYGKIDLGEYEGQVVLHKKYGKCILIHNGEAIKSIIPRRKYNWQFQMKEIFIHCGNKDTLSGDNIDWRGSAGCITIRKSQWQSFIKNFKDGEKVNVIVRQDGRE